MTILLMFVAGLAFLIVGAEFLVRGASRLAAAFGIPPLIIGLTVVAFGTSAPEFSVSLQSAFVGQANIVVGNVIGSNIFNILFMLGVSALISPLLVSQQLVRVDVPLMIGISAIAWGLAWDRSFSRIDGFLLFGGLVTYICFLIYYSRTRGNTTELSPALDLPSVQTSSHWAVNVLFVVGGLILLMLGATWLVDSAIAIAQLLGVSELIIGLTIVAVGTSLPEVITSIVATMRGERDIAVGNVVGSNMFNLMGVLGLAAIFAPAGIDVASSAFTFDFPIMITAAFACLPIFFTHGIISRWEGGVLLAYYIAYTSYLLLAASHHDSLPVFSNIMVYFVVPLTLITLAVLTINELRRRRIADGK